MPYEEVVTNLLQRLGLGYLLGENHSFDFQLLFSVSSNVFSVDSVHARNSQHLGIPKIQTVAFVLCLSIAYYPRKHHCFNAKSILYKWFCTTASAAHIWAKVRHYEVLQCITLSRSNTHPSACGSQDHLYHAATWASPTDFMSWTNAMKQCLKKNVEKAMKKLWN